MEIVSVSIESGLQRLDQRDINESCIRVGHFFFDLLHTTLCSV